MTQMESINQALLTLDSYLGSAAYFPLPFIGCGYLFQSI